MDIDHEEKLLLMEVQTLFAESAQRMGIILANSSEDDRSLRKMGLARMVASRDLMGFLPEGEDWLDEFGTSLEETIEAEEERYDEAKRNENREVRLVVLANLSILKRLRNRLTDPRRRQALKSEIYTDPLYPPSQPFVVPGFPLPFEGISEDT